jgi:hypothetical protein
MTLYVQRAVSWRSVAVRSVAVETTVQSQRS